MKTIPAVFIESVKKYAQNPLMLENTNNQWDSLSYQSMYDLVKAFTLGLADIGVGKGDRLSLIAEGRNDWVMSELSILCAGAINVPISVRIEEADDLKFRLLHSECKMVIVSGRHAHKVLDIKDQLPLLEKIIVLDEIEAEDSIIIHRDEILELGKKRLETNPNEFEEIANSVQDDDVANICYTSGTTADPKGIMLTHRNYTANLEQACQLFEVPEHYTTLLILPWDHAFAHTVGVYMLMYNGASMASLQLGKTMLETTRNVGKNIKEIKPYFLLSVPALAKNFKNNIENGIKSKGKTLNRIFNYGVNTAIKLNGDGFNKPRVVGRWYKSLLVSLIDKIIFSKVRENFGGRLLFLVGGGALLDIDLQKFFYAIGMPMYQGYGLTEAAPIISSNTVSKHKMGSSGWIPDSMIVKICDDDGNELPLGQKGEIVVHGENVMKGYWRNEEASADTVKDGWLYTGDMGYKDADGFLNVLGRFKSLLIGSDGEKYSPEGIEEAVVEKSRFIDEIVLVNNQHAYTSGMIVVNRSYVKSYLKHKNLNVDEEGAKVVVDKLKRELNRFRDGGEFSDLFPARWLPASFVILDEEFTQENKMRNSTTKIVRNVIMEHFKDRLDYMYSADGKDVMNEENYKSLLKYLKN